MTELVLDCALVVAPASPDFGSARIRAPPELWTKAGIPYHSVVVVKFSTDLGEWTCLCTTALSAEEATGNNSSNAIIPTLDARVVIPPSGFSVESGLQPGVVLKAVRVGAWSSPPAIAAAALVHAPTDLPSLSAIRPRLHQALVTEGCCLQLGGGAHLRCEAFIPTGVIRSWQAARRKGAVYRIVPSTQLFRASDPQGAEAFAAIQASVFADVSAESPLLGGSSSRRLKTSASGSSSVSSSAKTKSASAAGIYKECATASLQEDTADSSSSTVQQHQTASKKGGSSKVSKAKKVVPAAGAGAEGPLGTEAVASEAAAEALGAVAGCSSSVKKGTAGKKKGSSSSQGKAAGKEKDPTTKKKKKKAERASSSGDEGPIASLQSKFGLLDALGEDD